MAVISVALSDRFEDWRTKTNSISSLVGDGADIVGTVIENIIAANSAIGDLNLLETTVKTDLVSAINETKRGSLALAIALG
ncbi:MAG TPA: hypothetical protein PK317_04785 [Coprothermobacter proteolyticus]|nr:hypothetical protein [Coprothermobacter proteolyticus]